MLYMFTCGVEDVLPQVICRKTTFVMWNPHIKGLILIKYARRHDNSIKYRNCSQEMSDLSASWLIIICTLTCLCTCMGHFHDGISIWLVFCRWFGSAGSSQDDRKGHSKDWLTLFYFSFAAVCKKDTTYSKILHASATHRNSKKV